ncbi:MAG: hypothetical protein JWN65_2715 [Solirubrobacterales bacterium]|nr:hypothetical protein [Solirubrobacterales bacterium]
MTDVKQLLDDTTAKLRTEADKLEARIDKREREVADELQPLRAELAEIRDAIARIEGTSPRSSSGTRAPRGHNRRLLLDAVADTPERTGSELAAATGIPTATAYATLAKLAKDGLVVKNDREGRVTYMSA